MATLFIAGGVESMTRGPLCDEQAWPGLWHRQQDVRFQLWLALYQPKKCKTAMARTLWGRQQKNLIEAYNISP